MTLHDLQTEAREKWGIEVGPNSTQRGQENVLCELISTAYQLGKDASVEYIKSVTGFTTAELHTRSVPESVLEQARSV